ncbi:hypothetical protein SUGI_0780320 [Cryptomeria japonica]|nr:hypothetical protein SUGI_0780320 [Cryptomeria japonica]
MGAAGIFLRWAWWAIFLVSVSYAQKCPRVFNMSSGSVKMVHCKHLPQLGATLSWTYHAETGMIDLAFKAKPPSESGWVAWGINPTTLGMVGTQALLAFRQSNGSMSVNKYNVTSKGGGSPPLVLSSLSFSVSNFSSEYRRGSIIIYASVVLPSNQTLVNQVWQVGPTVSGTQPGAHAFDASNLMSLGQIDLLKGKIPQGPAPAPAPVGGGLSPSGSPSSAATAPTGTSDANAQPTGDRIVL